jgi:hypothetical protein
MFKIKSKCNLTQTCLPVATVWTHLLSGFRLSGNWNVPPAYAHIFYSAITVKFCGLSAFLSPFRPLKGKPKPNTNTSFVAKAGVWLFCLGFPFRGRKGLRLLQYM